ncbi:MAG: cadherin domain-containing protein, partial [Anaerolineaceae bacterium]
NINVVTTVSASDVDQNASLSYSLTGGADRTLFQIQPLSGLLSFTSAPDYENRLDADLNGIYEVTVQVSDGSLTDTQTLYVTVVDVNETPTDVSLSGASVAENQPAGTFIGSFSTTDPDAGNTFTYQLVTGEGSTDNSRFEISGNALSAKETFDFETKTSYSIRVRSTDQGGLSTETSFTIQITNVNEAPTSIWYDGLTIDENMPVDSTAALFGASDPDAGALFSFTLVSGSGDADNGSFHFSGSTLLSSAVFDYETQKIYFIRVRVTDQGGLTNEQSFAITINDLNEPPVDMALSNGHVAENQPAGDEVGTLSSSDPDAD